MKVAIVHDYLREYGGAERVVETLHEIFPDAPIYTAYLNLAKLGVQGKRIKEWDIRSSWMQYLPFANRLISPFRLVAAQTFKRFHLKDYDVIISSSNSYFAKAVKTTPSQLHIAYIHSPPRYLYGFTTSFNYKKKFWTRVAGELANHYLRIVDYEVSQKPDILVANSKNVAQRIKKFYRRDAAIIYPPIETNKLKEARVVGEGGYFLSVARLVKGKGVDIIVKACSDLNLPLKVVGSGPQMEDLKSIAGQSVEFLGQVSDEDLLGIYASAGATIVASEDEDFGMTPVESMAAGTPVIAVAAGGFLESVIPGKTGEFFDSAKVESLKNVLKDFDYTKYTHEDCQKQSDKFSKEQFKKSLLDLIHKNLK